MAELPVSAAVIGYPVGVEDEGNDDGVADGNEEGKLDEGAVVDG